ncbi:MAG: Mur ligase family protein [Candidatus Paceibacteria bacterium]
MLQRIKNLLWHPALVFAAAVLARFPARSMTVIGVTGTKGKSSVAEMLYEVFAAAGHKTALASGIHFAYPGHDESNRFKMTMPGRGFLQRFLAKARRAGATHAIVELTSEGALQSRHRFLFLDALVVTNIQREHIEAHGSFEKYAAAKRGIVRALERSLKKRKVLIVNGDDTRTRAFLDDARVPVKLTFEGAKLPGEFHEANVHAAVALAKHFGIAQTAAEAAIRAMPQIKGRMEPVECGQPFSVIVDYAHTPDSLEALYGAFPDRRKICVLGATGGGRDTWKRPEMGAIAERECDDVILTDEDPYNEDPRKIVEEVAAGMKRPPRIIMDRREAIATALTLAKPNDVVLVSGKGTDPYIMKSGGEKLPWSDSAVAREELEKFIGKAV